MARKTIIVVWLVALALTLFRLADAQQQKRVPRIGYLSSFHPATDSTRSEAIRLALASLAT